MPRPLTNAQNGVHKKTTTTRRHQEKGRHKSGQRGITTEEDRRPGLEVQPTSGTEGTGHAVEVGKGGYWFGKWRRKDVT